MLKGIGADGMAALNSALQPCSTTSGGVRVHVPNARYWAYPKYPPMRDYQFRMVATALFHNTLVCLPTGLGKTLIAAVVMFNYYRWFPEGKVTGVHPYGLAYTIVIIMGSIRQLIVVMK